MTNQPELKDALDKLCGLANKLDPFSVAVSTLATRIKSARKGLARTIVETRGLLNSYGPKAAHHAQAAKSAGEKVMTSLQSITASLAPLRETGEELLEEMKRFQQ